MKILHRLLIAATLLIAGCVGVARTIDTASTPKPGMGFLTGIFVDASTQSMPIRKLLVTFENQETKTQHTVEFQKDGRDLQLLEVPPGTYRVSNWYLASMFNAPMITGKPQGALFTREFKVAADQVHFLGHFTGTSTVTNSGNMVYYNAQLKPERIVPVSTDRDDFAKRFPSFGKLPMRAAFF
jgi:hypothetical protein